MAQVLLGPNDRTGNRFRIGGDAAHYLVRVMRAQVGDSVKLFDGQGARFEARLTAVNPTAPSAEGEILREIPRTSFRHFRLLQGLPKGAKFDFVIEKAVELGAAEIVPFLSEKSLLRIDEDGGRAKQARWSRLAAAAARQCERADLAPVRAPVPFERVVEMIRSKPTLVFSTSVFAPTLAAWFSRSTEHRSFFDGDSVIINIIIGPESGLSSREESQLVEAGAHAVSLGSNILRTETAGLAALAILNFQFNQVRQS